MFGLDRTPNNVSKKFACRTMSTWYLQDLYKIHGNNCNIVFARGLVIWMSRDVVQTNLIGGAKGNQGGAYQEAHTLRAVLGGMNER